MKTFTSPLMAVVMSGEGYARSEGAADGQRCAD